MHYTCKLSFKSYMPKRLEKGMYFLIRRKDEMEVIQLEHVPLNEEEFLQDNGYPVELVLVDPGNPNLNDGFVIAQEDEIGWWDDGEHTDELRDITIKEINNIIQFNDGWVDIEIDEDDADDDILSPILYSDKVVLSYTEQENEDDDEEYFFDADEPYEPPQSNDEWENNFTNPNHDFRYEQDS